MNRNNLVLYRMENNHFLGECLAVVCHTSQKEQFDNGLTSSDIAIYIKTSKSLKDINSLEDLFNSYIFSDKQPIYLRISSECHFGSFGDSHCDCESQKISTLDFLSKRQGIYVHLPQEAQGRGLYYKAQELQLQVNGLKQDGAYIGKKSFEEAAEILLGNKKVDRRSFIILKSIFREMGFSKYKFLLLTSNPRKIDELKNSVGISIIGHKDVAKRVSIDNLGEYISKIYLKSFQLDEDELRQIYEVILSSDFLPKRALSAISSLKKWLEHADKHNSQPPILRKIIKAASLKNDDDSYELFQNIGNARQEHQIELKINNKQLKNLFKGSPLIGISELAFEQNYFYVLSQASGVRNKDLKIRRRSKVTLRTKNRVIDSTIVYKVRLDDNSFKIRDMLVQDNDLANLILLAFKTYEVDHVPVFTHTCELEDGCYPNVLVLLKRYTKKLRTISLMGDESSIREIIEKIESEVGGLEPTPDPTNLITLNKDLITDFDYHELAKQELQIFKKYYIG